MRLRIQASQAPHETFLAQVELIKSSGAQMDDNKIWWHNTDSITPRELDKLFEAARTYGTYVTTDPPV